MIAWIGPVVSSAVLVAATPYEARYDGRPAAHWAGQLASKDPDERERAAFALQNIACCVGVGTRVSGHVGALASALRDPDVDVRTAAASALGCTGADARSATKDLVGALRDPDAVVRRAAARALGRIPPDATAASALTLALHDEDAGVVETAAEALSWAVAVPESAVPHLIAALQRKERTWAEPSAMSETSPLRSIGEALANALAATGGVAVPALTRALSDPNPFVRQWAAIALYKMGRAAMPAAPALSRAARDEHVLVRCSAMRALGVLGVPDVPAARDALVGDAQLAGGEARPQAWDDEAVMIAALAMLCPPPTREEEDAARHGAEADIHAIRARLAAMPPPPLAAPAAAPLLVAALGDGSAKVRLAAAQALGLCGQDYAPAVDALVAALRSADEYLARDATLGLARLARTSPPVVAALTDAMARAEPAVRIRLVDALAAAGPEGGAALLGALRDPSCAVRLEAAGALLSAGVTSSDLERAVVGGLSTTIVLDLAHACHLAGRMEHAPAEAASLLVRALRNEDDHVAISAARALGCMDTDEATVALVSALRSDRRSLKDAAAEALSRTHRARAVTPLMDALESGDASLRRAIESILWAVGPDAKSAVPRLVVALDRPDPALRDAALRLLRRIGPDAREAMPRLVSLLSDPDARVRELAVAALGSIGAAAEGAVPDVVSAGREALGDMSPTALQALARMGPAGAKLAAPALLTAARRAHGMDVDVNSLAAIGAAGVATDEVVPLIAEIVSGPCPSCRKTAAEALGTIGPGAKDAVPALTAALLDDEPEARVAAAEALGRIGPAARSAIPTLEASLADPFECDAMNRAVAAALLAVRRE